MTEETYARRLKEVWITFGFGLYQVISMWASTYFISWLVLLLMGLGLMIIAMARGAYLDFRWRLEHPDDDLAGE